jgi:ferritin-like metal-binding protein YciE
MDNRGTGPSRDRRLPCPHASQADESLREADPLIAIAGGEGVNLFNSLGNPWTADYLKITGELDVDLRSNIAAEARAKIVYERLINFCNDAGTKDALQFLMTREITHMRAFTAALVEVQEETEAQVERLNECFDFLGTPARAKPCKGMMGLVEEGEEVMAESKKKDDAAADLALIAAAQRVEHYEMSGYTTARNLAQQLHHSAIVQHLSKSLAEEENADQLLNQVARPLMSVAKMPAAVD